VLTIGVGAASSFPDKDSLILTFLIAFICCVHSLECHFALFCNHDPSLMHRFLQCSDTPFFITFLLSISLKGRFLAFPSRIEPEMDVTRLYQPFNSTTQTNSLYACREIWDISNSIMLYIVFAPVLPNFNVCYPMASRI